MHTAAIKINGSISLELDAELIDIRVHHTMSATAVADILVNASTTDASNSGGEIPGGAKIGAPVEVVAIIDGTDHSIFKGEIVSLTYLDEKSGQHWRVRAADKTHRLWANSKRRTFLNLTAADIATRIIEKTGLSAKIDATDIAFDYIAQYASDGEFLSEILGRAGMGWHTVGDAVHAHNLAAGKGNVDVDEDLLVHLNVSYSAVPGTTSVHAQSWDPKTQKAITRDVTAAATARTALSAMDSDAKTFPKVETTVNRTVMLDLKEAEQIAEGRLNDLHADRVRMRLVVDGAHANYRPGYTVDLKKGPDVVRGKYMIAGVVSHFSLTSWETTLSTGSTAPALLPELTAAAQSRGQNTALQGVMIGVVNELGKGEFAGMVKVQLPTLFTTDTSHWARVVSVGAGAHSGLQMMPQVNDEVAVMFEQGDARRPLILGGLWSAKNELPLREAKWLKDGSSEAVCLRTPEGQQFTMTSIGNEADRHMSLTDGDKLRLYLGMDKVQLWSEDGKAIEIQSGPHVIVINDKGEITVKGKKITLESTGDILLDGQNVTVKANAKFSVDAQGGFELKTNATGDIKGTSVNIAGTAGVNLN